MSGQFCTLAMFCRKSTHRKSIANTTIEYIADNFLPLNVDLIMFHAIKFWTISLEIRQITTIHRIWMTHMEEAQTVYVTTESPQAQSANKMGGARQQLCWLLIFTFCFVTPGLPMPPCLWVGMPPSLPVPLAMPVTFQPKFVGTS